MESQKRPSGLPAQHDQVRKRVVRGSEVIADYQRSGVQRSSRTASSNPTVNRTNNHTVRSSSPRPNGTVSPKKKRPLSKQMRKRRRRRNRILLIIGIVLLVLILLGVFLFQYYFGGLKVRPISEDADLGINSEIELDDSITNIALFGIDARDEEADTGLSDAIMILSVDNKHGKIKLVSIARDTLVPIDGYGTTKINAAYSYGGPELAIRTLNQVFNLNIENYVTVNFYQLADIIDAVGGVDIYVEEREMRSLNNIMFDMTHNGDWVLDEDKPGMLHLNGAQAVAFSRIRKIDSDDARTERQREVLTELFNKALDLKVTEYPEFARKLLPMCTTSMGVSDILSLAPILATDVTMEMGAFPNEYIDTSKSGKNTVKKDDIWYYVYDTDQAAEMLHTFIYDDLTFAQQFGDGESSQESSELSNVS
jgi:LCP family protein required for cell wall assembly